MPSRLVGLALLLFPLVGCSSATDTPTLLVTDQCEYNGPDTVAEGAARLTLQRSGLGDYAAAVVRFDADHTVEDLEGHFDEVSQVWDERPEWLDVRYLLEVNDDNIEAATGDSVIMTLDAGDHAVVCISYNNDFAAVVARVAVTAATG